LKIIEEMVQAKRKKSAKKSGPGNKPSYQGLGMLVIGMIIGAMVTALWQGTRSADGGVGTGIRRMIETSRTQDISEPGQQARIESEKPQKRETNYDFFTVLPEIEVVVSDEYAPATPVASEDAASVNKGGKTAKKSEVSRESGGGGAYMLQAGSYRSSGDAERLKAELALKGLRSTIQKVSIQGRGDFYRVRLGPYSEHGEMVSTDQALAQQGIKALRLKISKGG